mgnify:CR=1 FL=1
MTRKEFCERVLMEVYGTYPSDDSSITYNLVHSYLGDATAVAAKANYTDNIKIDGIGYVNGAFYTTYKSIAVTSDEQFLWKLTLPHIPVGLGRNEGISTLQFKDADTGQVSLPCIPISESQRTYFQTMRPIPNKVLFYNQGEFIYILTTILMTDYTATVTMVSAGDGTDLMDTLNVPSDYFPIMIEYIKQQLMLQRSVPQDPSNDGSDKK